MDDEEANVKVTVKVGGHVFTIPCGRGEQNMKWLACVVAQRFRLMSKSNGRARQRERRKAPQGFFVPSAVTDGAGQLVYPSVKVRDAVQGGTTAVKVGLKNVESCDEDGTATQTTWAALAFNFSDQGRKRAEKKRLADLEKARLAHAEDRKAAQAKEQERMDQMAKLLAVDLDSPMAVEKAMAKDWPYIRIDWFTSSTSEVQAIKKLFLTHFVGLTDLYKHYSGSSSSGSVASMNKLEFQHVCLVCRICDVAKEKKLIEKVFADANKRRNNDPDQDALSLTRFEFFESLLNLAIVKFSVDRSTGERLLPPQAFKKLLDMFVLPRIAQMAAGSVRQAMQTHVINRHFADSIEALRWVFQHYSTLASDQGLPDNRDTVNLMEFCTLLQDSGLLRDDLSHTHSSKNVTQELTQTAAREIFAGVQRDEAGPYERASIDNPMQELVLSEFLEAIARTGFVKWQDTESSVTRRIQLAIDAVVALAPAEYRTKPKKQVVGLFSTLSPRRPAGGAGSGAGAGAGTFTKSFITEGVGLATD